MTEPMLGSGLAHRCRARPSFPAAPVSSEGLAWKQS